MATSTTYWALPIGNGHRAVTAGQMGPQTFQLGKRYFQPVAERDDATYSNGIDVFVEPTNSGRDIVAFSDGLASCYTISGDPSRGGITLWISLNTQTALQGVAGTRIGIKGLRPDAPAIVTVVNADSSSMNSCIRALINQYYSNPSTDNDKNILDTKWHGQTIRHYVKTNNQNEIDSFISAAISGNLNARFYLRAGDKIGIAAPYMGYFGSTATPPGQNFHYGINLQFDDRAGNKMNPELVLAALARNSLTSFGKRFTFRRDIETMAEIDARPPNGQAPNPNGSNLFYSHPLIRLMVSRPIDPFPLLQKPLSNGKKPIPIETALTQYHTTFDVARRLWRYTAGPNAGPSQLITSIDVFDRDANGPTSDYMPSGQELSAFQSRLVALWDYGSNVAGTSLSADNIINDLGAFFDIPVEEMLSFVYQESYNKAYPVRLEPIKSPALYKKKLLQYRSQWQLPNASPSEVLEKYRALVNPNNGYSFESSNSININDLIPNGAGTHVNRNSFTYKELFALLNAGNVLWGRVTPGLGQTTLDNASGALENIQNSPRYSVTQLQGIGIDPVSVGLTTSSSGEEWFKWLLVQKNGYRAAFSSKYVLRERIYTDSRSAGSLTRFVLSHLDMLPVINAYNHGHVEVGPSRLWGFSDTQTEYFANAIKAFNAYKLHPVLPTLSRCYLVKESII